MFSSDYGLVSSIITSLGGQKIPFCTEPKWWTFIIVFFNLWKGVSYGSVLYLAAIMGIDTSVYETATIDGANVWRRITKSQSP